MTWLDGPLAGIDLETTSANPDEARIVSATVVHILPAKTDAWLREARFDRWAVNPGVPIPPAATAIHGISDEQARAEGVEPALALEQIVAVVAALLELGAPLVDFNARYDLTVLERECERHGLEPPWSAVAMWVLDPLVIDKWLERYRPGSRKLQAMCQRWGAKLEGAHADAFDAIAACRVAWALGKRGWPDQRPGPELEDKRRFWQQIRDDLPALHKAQRRWAAEQAEGLEEHFRRQGKAERVAREWPILPRGHAEARPEPPPAPAQAELAPVQERLGLPLFGDGRTT